ncbi:MAG: amylo-alpha-1,6-glucosidase [Planctomycetaceae bacterium]
MLLSSLSRAEWLETDGLGGFAMGTADGVRTRRYHGWLLTATSPPTGRVLLVSGCEAWIETASGREALTTQNYRGDVRTPDGETRLESFTHEPWPQWRFRLSDGTRIDQELFIPRGLSAVCLRWRMSGTPSRRSTLRVRPLLAARDYHSLQHENAEFRLDADVTSFSEISANSRRQESRVVWRPYNALPAIVSWSNGDYQHEPDWYRHFMYSQEVERGMDYLEDLASPGVLSWDLSAGEAVWLLAAESHEPDARGSRGEALTTIVRSHSGRETARRSQFPTTLHRAAADYVVQRGSGKTIIAGYPWFTDWGRDTFIALRGLCLASGDLATAESILLRWADMVSEGMLPNRFPDSGESPEFNSVDASLWFVIVAHEFLKLGSPAVATEAILRRAITAILGGYARGTRFGIRLEDDGLIAAGQPGVQLTWMDAKVGDWVVTPRIGKPVEVQALWLNALWLELQAARQRGDDETVTRWNEVFERGRRAFEDRFWNEAEGCLFDVVDVDHRPGEVDASFRPNQIFAVGGLPLTLLPADQAKQVVEAVESRLWTPLGLRSLAPGSAAYKGRYSGSVWQRDAAYHQGTEWAWLIGPFVEAWIKTRDDPQAAKQVAYRRFIEPLLAHRHLAGLGHVSEIADADWPHTPRGCPFQAWSVGEALRWHQLLSSGC